MTMPVAGVDRWRKGWVAAVVTPATSGSAPTAHLDRLTTHATAEALVDALADCGVVLVDMPMAVPTDGTRAAERELRRYLGRSASSVFTTPTRAAIAAADRAVATDINRANGGPGISAQAWGLVASIIELRAALGERKPTGWFETHPESTFALMNGDQPLDKKRSARGVGQRLELLASRVHGLALPDAPLDVPVDDVLDAVAAAWSACRVMAGAERSFGPVGHDDHGFETSIRI